LDQKLPRPMINDQSQLTITRSIEVICLAQFFALIPRQLYRDKELSTIYELNMAALSGRRSHLTLSIRRDCKNCAIPGGPPGQFPANNRDNQPVDCAR
jgi:hypothetical protein